MKRFLISRLSSLGDVVCSLPAAGALKAAFPDCEVTWVVDRRFRSVPACCRWVDHVFEASRGVLPSSWPRFEGRFDAALDLQGLLKSAIPVWRAQATQKLGFHWQREGAWLFSKRVNPDPSSLHVVDQYVDVARAAGGTAHAADFGLSALEEDLASVRAMLSASKVEGPFAVLNPGAAWASKRWPPASFAYTADRLSEAGTAAVLVGAKSEVERQGAAAVIDACRTAKPVSLVGQTTIGQLIALIQLSAAHLGGDTGSTHIAAALGRPAIGLYSATRPERTCPYGQIDRCHFSAEGLARIDPEVAAQSLLEALT